MAVVLVSRNPMLAMALEGTTFDVVEVAPTRLEHWLESDAALHEAALVLDLGSSRAAVDAVTRLRAAGRTLPVLVVVSNPDKEPELLSLARTGVIGPPVTAARVGAALTDLLAQALVQPPAELPSFEESLPSEQPTDQVDDERTDAADTDRDTDADTDTIAGAAADTAAETGAETAADAAASEDGEDEVEDVEHEVDEVVEVVEVEDVEEPPASVARAPRDDLRAALLEPVPELPFDDAPRWLTEPDADVPVAAAPSAISVAPAAELALFDAGDEAESENEADVNAAGDTEDVEIVEDIAAADDDTVDEEVEDDAAADDDTVDEEVENDAAADDDAVDEEPSVVVDLRKLPRSRAPSGPLTSVAPQDDLRHELLTARAGAVASVTHMETRRRPEPVTHRAPAVHEPVSVALSPDLSVASIIAALTDVETELFGVVETAEVIVADAVERAASDGSALLVPDGKVWRVSAGEGLRSLEMRYQLVPDDWLVERVAEANKGVIVEGSDAARHALRGAPLASRKHLIAVPIQLPDSTPGAILLVARDDDPPFDEQDLVEMARLAREAAPLLTEALRLRDVARALSPYRDLD